MEVCPNCGELVDTLTTDEGWCKECAGPHQLLDKLEVFLSANADHIEHYMANGSSLYQAIDNLRLDVAPTCLSCGVVIKHGRRDALFCTKTPQCRSSRRRYIYLYQTKGLSKSEALGKVLSQLNGS